MRLMAPVPSPQRDGDRSPGALANIILETVRSAGLEMGERIEIGVSMASYLRDNHPLVALHGGYVNVDGVENLGKWLGEYVTRESGAPARVRLIHDGTASALSVSPSPNAAAITLGTVLGVGFARPSGEGLTPLSPDFRVV